MLTLFGKPSRYCDGVSRRSFMQIGSLAFGGLSLPQILKAEEVSQDGSTQKSVIMVYLSGGISHQDTFDLKPDAPDGIRGEFNPIQSNLPDVQVSEHLPYFSQCMDKVALIRSIVGLRDEHSSFQNITGFPRSQSLRERKPNFGSVISKIQGSAGENLPAYVDMFPTMRHKPYNISGPGILGPEHRGVLADGEQLASMKLRYVDRDQFGRRQQLLQQLTGLREKTLSREMAEVDSSYSKAFEVLTSNRLVEALNLDKEKTSLRDRYGRGSSTHLGDGAPMWNDQLLQARRLVEAGVRCVTVAYGFWDTHGNNFAALKQRLPLFDQGITALIEDLHDRGLDKDVTVVVWGEFGRKPQINENAGRDHWAGVSNAILAGGGMNVGQVIGATDKLAGSAVDRPVHYRDVLATIYHNLGIGHETAMTDVTGSRIGVLPPEARPIRELI